MYLLIFQFSSFLHHHNDFAPIYIEPKPFTEFSVASNPCIFDFRVREPFTVVVQGWARYPFPRILPLQTVRYSIPFMIAELLHFMFHSISYRGGCFPSNYYRPGKSLFHTVEAAYRPSVTVLATFHAVAIGKTIKSMCVRTAYA